MKRVLTAIAIVLLVAMLILIFQSCGKGRKIIALEQAKSALMTSNKDLNSEIARAKQNLANAEKAKAYLLEVNVALQEKADGFAKTNTGLAAEVKKSKADMSWWFNQAGKLKGLLAAAEKAQQDLGDQMEALEGEKDELQGEHDGLIAEKAALGGKLASLQGKANADAKEAKVAIAELERKLKEANEKIRQLEIKISASNREIAELKNRALSVEEKTAKKRAAADSFKIYVVLTAVSPNLDLKEEIRALAAEILPKMYSVSDDELYRIAEPIMAKMPQQDNVKSVPLLHAAWERWKEARTRYSRFKPVSPEERKERARKWLEEHNG